MIREKTMKIIAAFPTTTDAMRMQMAADAAELTGRLIPVPEQISAGCGIAWCSDVELRSKVEFVIKENGIAVQQYCEMMW